MKNTLDFFVKLLIEMKYSAVHFLFGVKDKLL